MFKEQEKLLTERIHLFQKRLQQLFYENKIELNAEYCKTDSITKPKLGYKPIATGTKWGKNWERAWFHITGTVPENWKDKHVVAKLNLGGEALVFDEDEVPVQSLSLHTIWPAYNFKREKLEITKSAKGNEQIDIICEVSAGQLIGLVIENDHGNIVPEQFGKYEATVEELSLHIFRDDIEQLYFDTFVLQDQMKALPEKSIRRRKILHTFQEVINCFDSTPEKVQKSRTILEPLLKDKSSASDLSTAAVGHAHLDTAWLWPLSETIRKCARTFANQIDNINKYQGYIFGASQPQHYAFVKEHYPSLYKKIKEKVKDGSWELQGGMWVEADCNLISGESMVRQILHGKNFFLDEFGIDVKNLWLPDVFGYSAAMPQIIKKTGMDYFVTQKISWNQFNKFPHNSFIWRGIDGSEIITHFPPEDNYNSEFHPSALKKAQENYSENYSLDEFLTLFGIGDGGGGATEKIIETGLRCQDLENCPRVKFDHAQNFLERLGEQSDKLSIWSGELYMEGHRGTLTTMAYNKKMNRFMELRMRELELLYSLLPASEYPIKQFDKIWKIILLNQFHDIIPGSSITPVYEESHKQYKSIKLESDNLLQKVGNLLFQKNKNSITIVNTLNTTFIQPVELPCEWNDFEIEVDNIPFNIEYDEGYPVIQIDIPELSYVTIKKTKKRNILNFCYKDELVLSNKFITYKFSETGQIISAFDKENQKEIFINGQVGNVINLYEDRPANWDAWDIDIYYEDELLETAKAESVEWICCGDVRQGLIFHYKVGNSTMEQNVYLAQNTKRLDFKTKGSWQEDHKLLRVGFTVNIKSDQASFEIQYGHIKRNTHRNTSWDMAKFEVVGHRWADLSEYDYGVALLNDCKYGYKIYENEISLSLLRAPSVPNPKADRCEHEFVYSFLPHNGDLLNSDVISQAAQLNQKAIVFEGCQENGFNIPYKIDNEHIILNVIKKSEKDDSIILRLYESKGRHIETYLNIQDIIEIYEADMMENNISKLKIKNDKVALSFSPFEIKTLKIIRK